MVVEVCVTGGTGYIASHIIHNLLNRGYRVRTTVRNPDDEQKVAFLWKLPGAKERLSIWKADLLEDGSFDAVIAGVDGVFHVASPVIIPHWESPEKSYLQPCLNGTANVLSACSKSSSVKKIVLTSSCSAVRYKYDIKEENDHPFDESHWSDIDYCKQHQLWYAWAKTISEKDAWRIANEKGLNLVVVNPSFVVGPILSSTPTSTIAIVWSIITGHAKTYPNSRMGYVHIDDVALAHMIAYEHPLASGRLICSGDVHHWRDIISMLKAKYPTYPITSVCGEETGNDVPHKMNTQKLQSLGLHTFISLEKMFDDCISSLRSHGLL